MPKIKEGKQGPKKANAFDFRFIKVLIRKQGSNEMQEVFIERKWVQKNNTIPHFASVIKDVKESEGVEITMNCNSDAFKWIMEYVRLKTDCEDEIESLEKCGEKTTQLEREL